MSDFVIFAARKQDLPFIKLAIAHYVSTMIHQVDDTAEPEPQPVAEPPKAEATITLPKRRGRPPKAAKRGPGRPRKAQ